MADYHNRFRNDWLPFSITVDVTIAGSSGIGEFQLPLINAGGINYRFKVDWGDNTTDLIQSWNQAEALHDYNATLGPAIYTITIVGKCDLFSFRDTGDKLKVNTLNSWGNIIWKSNNEMFNGCANMTDNYIDSPVTHLSTDMARMFKDCPLFNGELDMDTRAVTTMKEMFENCNIFNNDGSATINNWDTGNVLDMNTMFRDCIAFNQSINSWDTSSCTDMAFMFYNCTLCVCIFQCVCVSVCVPTVSLFLCLPLCLSMCVCLAHCVSASVLCVCF